MADLNNLATLGAQFKGLNERHPGSWPLAPRLLLAFLLFAVVIAAGWYLYSQSQLEMLKQGEQQEIQLKEEYKAKIQKAVNLEGLRKQKEQIRQYVATLEKQLPSKAEMDALLSDINQAGLGRGLQFQLFKPGMVLVKEYYAELPIDIKITGGYHDIAFFSSDIANLPRIVTLNNLSVTTDPKDGSLTLEAVAKTFRYLDAEEIAAQRKTATDTKKGAANP